MTQLPAFPRDPTVGDKIHISIGAGATNVAAGKNVTQNIGYTAEQVRVLIAECYTVGQPRTWDGRIPYVGLTAFQEADAEFFFGREALVESLLEQVKAARFLCIAGPSGSGKSSLAQAGLIHALRSGRLDGSRNWLYASLAPRSDPIEQLSLAVVRASGLPNGGDVLRGRAANDFSSLHQQAELLLSHDSNQRFVIYVDQFEELFSRSSDEKQGADFLALLTEAVAAKDGRVTVILSIRSDFLSQCTAYPKLLSLINQHFRLVGAMSSQELALAIIKPALAVGAEIEPGLVVQMIADMKGEPGMLPLMQFALKDLFDTHGRKPGDVVKLTLSDYVDRGGIEEALGRHASETFSVFDNAQQETARRLFSYLIEVGHGEIYTRRTATYAELAAAESADAQIGAVIAVLTSARLLTTDAEGAQDGAIPMPGATVTIAHEKLIEAWPWLRRLVDENREAIALQNRVADDALQWSVRDCEPSYLYTGARLATVREQVAERKILLSGLARDFLTTAAEAEDKKVAEAVARQKQKLRRRNWTIAVLSTILLSVAVAGLLFGIREWRHSISSWKAVTNFPQNDMTVALSYIHSQANNSYYYCVGTLDLGIGCSDNGRSWNIYQNGLPIGQGPDGGVGPFSGEPRGITGITIDPTQPNVIYAYAMSGEIYKSVDAGQLWKATSAVLPQSYVADLTARNPFVVAVVKDYQKDSGHSLYFSPDGGNTWSLKIGPDDKMFGRVYDAFISSESSIYIGTDAGIFQSPADETLAWTSTYSDTGVLLLEPSLDGLSQYAIADGPQNGKWSLIRLYDSGIVDTLTTFNDKPVSLTVDPSPTSATPVYVLLQNWEVVAVTPQGAQLNLGGWKNFGPAWSILAVPDSSTGITRLLMGHYRGLLEYQAPKD